MMVHWVLVAFLCSSAGWLMELNCIDNIVVSALGGKDERLLVGEIERV